VTRDRSSTPPPAPPAVEPLDFKPTDLAEARAALEEPPAGVKILKRLDPSYWVKQRRPSSSADMQLSPQTLHWLQVLPPNVQPRELPRKYPRIANLLAEHWKNEDSCMQALTQLVVDNRGDRRGFPMNVLAELVALRDYRMGLSRERR